MDAYKFVELCFLMISIVSFVKTGASPKMHCPGVAKRTGHYLDVFNNTCYLFVGTEKHWDSAQRYCWGLGGELLSIKNMETMNYIKRILYSKELGWSNNGVWNGASDLRKHGWEWTTGERLDFSYWADGEPSKIFGFLSLENCACMRRSDGWRWHDYHCHAPGIEFKSICQFEMMHVPGKANNLIAGSDGAMVTVRDDTAAIVGLAVGAVLLLLLLSIALYILYKKHEQQKATMSEPAVRLQNTGYATIITHQETNQYDSESNLPSTSNNRPISNVYLDPMELGTMYEVPKNSQPRLDQCGSGEVSETTRLVYNGAAGSVEDNDCGYLSASASSEASGVTSGYCSSNTSKKVGDGDYIEMNGANGVGSASLKASNVYVQQKIMNDIAKKSGKPSSQEDIHIYTNQLDEVGYLRPLPPVPCGVEPPSKHV